MPVNILAQDIPQVPQIPVIFVTTLSLLLQRDHSRVPAYDQPRMSGPGEGMGAVTKGMERVSVQPPSQYSSRPREMSNNQDEEEWDWVELPLS